MKRIVLFLALMLASLPLLGSVRRLAIDIGSSAVKVLVAEVDSEQGRILEILERRSFPLAIRLDIKESGTEIITDLMGHRLIERLSDVVKRAKELGVTEYACVATAAFREARNSKSMAKTVARQVGIEIHVIGALEEAVLGFEATANLGDVDRSRLVSWDVGGGSQELVALSRSGEYLFYTTPIGSESFAAEVMLRIRRLNPGLVRSPNPLSERDILRAIELAQDEVTGVPDALRARVARPDAEVVGIGALAFLDVKIPGDRYTRSQLREAALDLAGKRDRDLGQPAFAPYVVTNLALVVGTMQALGFQEIRVAQIDLTEGLVLDASYNHSMDNSGLPSSG